MGALQAGMAKTVITPPVGTQLAGYAGRTDPSTGVFDDLYAKALVLDDGENRLALVVCDLIGFGREMVAEIREAVTEQTGIPAEHTMITCTHTHCGPNIRDAGTEYVTGLKSYIAGAASAAADRLVPAKIGVGVGKCYMASNRRHPDSPSGVYNLYRYPEGTMDPTVMVLRAEDLDGNILGAVTNYAAHPVGWGHRELMISRDFPGFALSVLEKAWGPEAVAVFLQGCCGNLNLNWKWDRPDLSPMPRRDFPEEVEPRLRELRRLGHMLGGESLNVAESIMDLTVEASLSGKRRDVVLPVRGDLPEKMAERVEAIREKLAAGETPDRRTAYHDIAEGKTTITTEVQVLRIGEHYVVGLPSEVFVEYQMEVRERVDAPFTFVSELANDTISYVPTPAAYEEGGYEERSTFLAPEAGG
ncbi:MAG: neutral/alkaline non-lysosomal ceramidase N-terminal domain-containing protein, partial [Candidatus Latescibacteria bacterium]|nr:neutral/alkaline non-lysosomal ceramidase N-terminal domain-containing protein [Candidatus Latescibacterota bacterium]